MSNKFACDTSVIFNGQILSLIEEGELGEKPEIFISNVVIAEVEYRTNIHKEIGFFGLNVLKQLRQLHDEGVITLHVIGKRPSREEIKMAPGGELDALIRESALENSAVLITADRIQGDVGVFEGLDVLFAWERKILKDSGSVPPFPKPEGLLQNQGWKRFHKGDRLWRWLMPSK